MSLVIEVYRRVRNSWVRYTDAMGPHTKFDWIAQWSCPGCGRQTVETFGDTQPSTEQSEGITRDPLCVRCRQHQCTGATLPQVSKP